MLGAEFDLMSTDYDSASQSRSYRCKVTDTPISSSELQNNCCLKKKTIQSGKLRVCSTQYMPQSSGCAATYLAQCHGAELVGNEQCKSWAYTNPTNAQPAARAYCTPDKILTDPFCKEMNARSPGTLGADYGVICNIPTNVGLPVCQDFCTSAEGQGKCDSAMRAFCSKSENRDLPSCSCLNDESAAPLCFNPQCQSSGYKTQSLMQFATQECGTYINCRQSIDPSGGANSAANNQQILQCVANGGPSTPPPATNGRNGPAQTNLPGESPPPGSGGPPATPPANRPDPDDDAPFTVWDRPGDVFDDVYAKFTDDDTVISEDPTLYPLYDKGPTVTTMELAVGSTILGLVFILLIFYIISRFTRNSNQGYGMPPYGMYGMPPPMYPPAYPPAYPPRY